MERFFLLMLTGEYGAVDNLKSGIKIMSFRIELTGINDWLVVV
ncbi:hypothetical protein [Dyadobacter sp. CY312]|nr:hypothetical protein [Dyadobacter sp. CY312]